MRVTFYANNNELWSQLAKSSKLQTSSSKAWRFTVLVGACSLEVVTKSQTLLIRRIIWDPERYFYQKIVSVLEDKSSLVMKLRWYIALDGTFRPLLCWFILVYNFFSRELCWRNIFRGFETWFDSRPSTAY